MYVSPAHLAIINFGIAFMASYENRFPGADKKNRHKVDTVKNSRSEKTSPDSENMKKKIPPQSGGGICRDTT